MQETKEQRAQEVNGLKTLCEFLQNRVQRGPNEEALREYDKLAKKWVSLTYEQLANKVLTWRKALLSLDLKAGSRVAILLPNGVNAVCFDQAALANCLVPVPLHAIDTPASSAYILQDSGAEVLITSRRSKWEEIKKAGFDLSKLKKIIFTDESTTEGPSETDLKTWLSTAENVKEDLPQGPHEDDLACVVYTSGTTGKPKGVMLTHKNIASNVRSTLAHVKPDVGAVFLSFLPLSHMFERTAGYYLALSTGSTIVFNRSLQYLAEDFKLVKPDVLISVPRVYERIYGKLELMLAKKSKLQRALFRMAVDSGWRDFCARNHIANAERKKWLDTPIKALIGNKVSETLKSQFGGKLKVAISGGAALNSKVAKVFCGLGLPVIQGYGMTETSPIIAGNYVQDNDPATVGKPLKDVHVRLGEKEEIQVKGDLVMQGYWQRPEDTKNAFTEDGWLRTGDQGAFDSENRLKIVGRIKEIIVTSTGEKISPVDIESAVETLPLIEQCFAVGDGMPYIATLVSLNQDAWASLAKSMQLDPKNPESLKEHKVKQAVLDEVKRACKDFPAYAVPRNVFVTLEPWTIDNGLLTPTLKLKRGPMTQKYKEQIDEMYSGVRKNK